MYGRITDQSGPRIYCADHTKKHSLKIFGSLQNDLGWVDAVTERSETSRLYGRRYRRSQRRKEELKVYLQRILLGVSIICILIVFATVAVRTRKATQSVEAQTALMQASTVTVKTDTVKETETGLQPDPEANEEVSAAESRTESVIIIDPGHGGIDGGCVFDDIVEKDINRMIAVQVVIRLRNRGYEADLARKGDEYIDKTERVEDANARNARLYVSIHQNSCEDHSVAGIETWYDGDDMTRDSGHLAELIQQETVRTTGAVSRELVSTSDLCVTSKSAMPSCLIETGFLSNKSEREKLASKEYRDQLAEGIVNGIERYLNAESNSSAQEFPLAAEEEEQ